MTAGHDRPGKRESPSCARSVVAPLPSASFSSPAQIDPVAVRKHQVEENEGIICDHPCLAKPATVEEVIEMIEKYARK